MAPSVEAAAYVTGTPRRMTNTKLDAAGLDLRGEPFSLPAGEVSVAMGLEARKEQIDQKVGAQDLTKSFSTWSSSPMAGSFQVREAFAEVAAPLLRDVPLVRDLRGQCGGALQRLQQLRCDLVVEIRHDQRIL